MVLRPISSLRADPRNARTHSDRQIDLIAGSIRRFGFITPIIITATGVILAGHGRVEAARRLGLSEVPTIVVDHLSEAEKRAYVIADNRLAELAGWDRDLLRLELGALADLEFPVEITGFSTGEIDLMVDAAQGASADQDDTPAEPSDQPPVSRAGDLWTLGRHRLLCGDARSAVAYAALMGTDVAEMVVTDPPYNVRIAGNVSGKGRARHREFAMASGEMAHGEFVGFLTTVLRLAARHSTDGSIHYVCMDWRHMGALLEAGAVAYSELKNVCVWAKTNAGMGTFYRSQHELVFVFKSGRGAHINNFGLGESGRHRSNLWTYPGVNTFRASRAAELAIHPTVKPVALIADAIRDCSRRGGIVLDPFCGSGTILLAAERTGRAARAMEIDPAYVDAALRRWQGRTGALARLAGTGQSLVDLALERGMEPAAGDAR